MRAVRPWLQTQRTLSRQVSNIFKDGEPKRPILTSPALRHSQRSLSLAQSSVSSPSQDKGLVHVLAVLCQFIPPTAASTPSMSDTNPDNFSFYVSLICC